MASAMSNLMRRIWSWRREKCHQGNDQVIIDELNQLENMLIEIYRIIIWENFNVSFLSIIFVNVVFWLIIYLNFKLYGIIFTALLTIAFEQFWVNQISQYIHKNDSNPQPKDNAGNSANTGVSTSYDHKKAFKQCQSLLLKVYKSAIALRQTQPGLFCTLICFCLLSLSIIGKYVTSITFVYILLMLTMTVPGLAVHFLPSHFFSSLTNCIFSSSKGDVDEIELFLPESNQEVLEVLRLAGQVCNQNNSSDDEESNDMLLECISPRTSDTTESISSKLSFYPESSLMPSPEHSMDFCELNFLSTQTLPQSGGHILEFNENIDMNFLSKHFNGDGDSTDEEEFALNLKLPNEDGEKYEYHNLNNKNTNTSSKPLGKQLPSGASKVKDFTINEGDSSSDTDSFELITEKDM